MRRPMLALTALSALALITAAGCKAHNANVKEFSVAESETAHQSKAVFVDANNDDFRKENGKVPGAILLANYRSYDPATTLPADKGTQLVFYCSNRL